MRPQYPIINFPDGDYSSFKVQSGKNGYSFEYKANDPTVLESTRSLSVDKDKRGLFGPTTDMRRELRSDQYTMDGTRNIGGAITQDVEGKVSCSKRRVHQGGRWSTITRCNGRNRN